MLDFSQIVYARRNIACVLADLDEVFQRSSCCLVQYVLFVLYVLY